MSCHPSHKSHIAKVNRIEGQVRAVKKMIDEERYCVDILTLLKSIRGAISRVEKEILATHLSACVNQAMCSSDQKEKTQKIQEIIKLLSA